MENVGNSILKAKITVDILSEPVTLAEIKAGRVSYSDYDTPIATRGKVARLMIQDVVSKVFGEATVDCSFTHSGQRPITLPYGWFGELTQLEYRSCRLNDWQAISLDDTGFEIEDGKFFGNQGHWKMTYTTEAIEVTETMKNAIIAQALYLWDNRDNPSALGKICPEARLMIMPLIDGGLLL